MEASSHEKADTVRSPLPDSGVYRKPLHKYLDERPPKHTESMSLKTKHTAWTDELSLRRFSEIYNIQVPKLF